MNRNHLKSFKQCRRANGAHHRSAFAAASLILTASLLTVLLAACPSATPTPDDVPDNAVPGAPAITTTTPGDGKVTLVWTAPSNTGITGGDGTTGVITKYTVYHSESTITDLTAAGVTAVEVTGATTLTKEVTGLVNGTQYYFKVTAWNATGESTASTETSATPVPADAAPGAPTISKMVVGSTKQVTITWEAPSDTGITGGDGTTGVITKYTVYHSENPITDLNGAGVTPVDVTTGLTTEVDSLTDGTTYYFKVTATNVAGESEASDEKTATPQTAPPTAAAPGKPTAVTATAGDGKATLAWTAPTNTGYDDDNGTVGVITKFTVYYADTSFDSANLPTTNVDTADGTTTTADVPGLTGGTQYFFRVTATNTTGPSVLSDEVSTHANAPPGAPTLGIDVLGDTQITLIWTAPTEKGYINSDGTVGIITAYTVYYHTATFDGTNLPTTKVEVSDGNAASVVVTGLINDTPYFFGITATNATGEGALSTVRTGTPVRGDEPPGKPTNLQAVAGDKQVTVSWTAPTDPGYISGAAGTITKYTVYYHTAGFDATELWKHSNVTTPDGTTTSVDVTGLTNGQQYHFRIIVENNGHLKSLLSEEVTATPN